MTKKTRIAGFCEQVAFRKHTKKVFFSNKCHYLLIGVIKRSEEKTKIYARLTITVKQANWQTFLKEIDHKNKKSHHKDFFKFTVNLNFFAKILIPKMTMHK